jgi:hypothetical protein
MRKWFLKFLGCLVKEKNNFEVSDCFFKNPKISKSRIRISVPAFLHCPGQFPPVCNACHSRLSQQFSVSQVAFGTSQRRLPKGRNKHPKEGYWKDFQN